MTTILDKIFARHVATRIFGLSAVAFSLLQMEKMSCPEHDEAHTE